MKTLKRILPPFKAVKVITSRDGYEEIYQAEQKAHTAWLLDEDELIWEFVEQLAEANDKSTHETPLNLYDFYIAYNLKFPSGAVTLRNKSGVLKEDLKDFAALLDAVIHANVAKLFVSVKSSKLKVKLLQQFIYLRIYLPVTPSEALTSSVCGDLGIFGTKKAGKSALINALLGNEYAVSSPVLPTPNKVTYSAAKDAKDISLNYKDTAQTFKTADALQSFLQEEFSAANKNSETLSDMEIILPDFPTFLNGARLIDTPGSNFAAAKGHADITQKALAEVSYAVFVMNYSQYLTQDELNLFDEVYKHFNNAKAHRPILIALNRVDEIFDSAESKSYERAEDYINYRLKALGYENFLVVGVSAIQSVYFDEVTRLIEPSDNYLARLINFFKKFFVQPIELNEQLDKLKRDLHGSDKASVVVFVNNLLSDYEDFYGMKIDNLDALQKINRVNYLKCLLYNMTSGML